MSFWRVRIVCGSDSSTLGMHVCKMKFIRPRIHLDVTPAVSGYTGTSLPVCKCASMPSISSYTGDSSTSVWPNQLALPDTAIFVAGLSILARNVWLYHKHSMCPVSSESTAFCIGFPDLVKILTIDSMVPVVVTISFGRMSLIFVVWEKSS